MVNRSRIGVHVHTRRIWNYRYMYLFLLPAIIWYFVFCYLPMYGVLLAFKDYKYNLGIWGSPWAGMKYLEAFINSYDFWNIIKNTLTISFLKLFIGFPAPIILALMLNEIKNTRFKKFVQTASYLPYFVSWVVVVTLMTKFLSPNNGVINSLLGSWFGTEPIFFLGEPAYFYPLVLLSDIWKGVGWGSIIYLAALTSINPDLYQAATIDGAGRWKSLIHITLPSLKPVIGILFILSLGNLMHAGFEQLYLMQNPGVLDKAEILDTYTLKMGLKRGEYSYATMIGLFQALVGFLMVVTANKVSKKVTEVSLW